MEEKEILEHSARPKRETPREYVPVLGGKH